MPATLADASNSIKKSVTIRCSLRLPPSLSAEKAKELIKKYVLESTSEAEKFGAKVEILQFNGDNGFDTKELESSVK
jgi:acetylornithine deacetylase/succinyl-diaminopimelate desuccinylase-like protein